MATRAIVTARKGRKKAKPIHWMGSTKEALIKFPDEIKSEFGKQLRKVQFGEDPDDFEYMKGVGPGSIEIRLQDADGWYRVIYVAKFQKTIYVLHSLKKKTNATSQSDIDLAEARYREAKRDSKV